MSAYDHSALVGRLRVYCSLEQMCVEMAVFAQEW